EHDVGRDLGLGLEYEGAPDERGARERLFYRVTHTHVGGAPVVRSLELGDGAHTLSVERQPKGGYLLSAPGDDAPRAGTRRDVGQTFHPERSLTFSAEALAELGDAKDRIQDLGLRLTKAVGRIAYLGPLRERPE